jgi:hypothetical protein
VTYEYHGHAVGGKISPTYQSWKDMKARCNCTTKSDYAYYGGRGIKVCERWQSFSTFVLDMGARPAGMTLERDDNDGDYSPDNCRWATRKEQTHNTRRSVRVTYNGETMCVAEWAARIGISRKTLLDRLQRYGWTAERALTTPTTKGTP